MEADSSMLEDGSDGDLKIKEKIELGEPLEILGWGLHFMKLKLEIGYREKLKVVEWFGTKYPGVSLYLHEKIHSIWRF